MRRVETGVYESLGPLGFPDYAVNDYGDVVRVDSQREKISSRNQYGVPFVTLYRGTQRKVRQVSALVGATFIRDDYPEDWNTLILLDGDKTNVRVSNLEYRPRSYAIRYNQAIRESNPRDWILEHYAVDWDGTEYTFRNVLESAQFFGVLPGEIVSAIRNRRSPTFAPGVEFGLVHP